MSTQTTLLDYPGVFITKEESTPLKSSFDEIFPATSGVVEITPDVARMILKIPKNIPNSFGELLKYYNRQEKELANRTISLTTLKEYVQIMSDGEWVLNGECIIFDIDGNLMDGQHRLCSVIISGVTIRTWYIKGVQNENNRVMDTLDHVRKRSIADNLNIQGEKHCAQLSACLKILYKYLRGDRLHNSPSVGWSDKKAKDLLKNYPQVKTSVDKSYKQYHSTGLKQLLTVSQISFCRTVFSLIDEEKANEFFDKLATGANLDINNPILVLRERLLTADKPNKRLTAEEKLYLVGRAFLYWLNGQTLTKMQIPKKFPTLDEFILVYNKNQGKMVNPNILSK